MRSNDKGLMRDSNKTILIVEDNQDIRLLLKKTLESEGYEIIEAETGREAVSTAIEKRPDLILMDISLPLLDGLSATREIKSDERTKDVPILAVTAYHSARRRAISAGCSELIGKPVDIGELKSVIDRLINLGKETTEKEK